MSESVSQQRKALTGSSSRTLQQICLPIRESMAMVRQGLEQQIECSGPELAERLRQSGLADGKGIRPAMLLLSGACFGDLKKTHVAAATAIELVHVATLVHDDVLDGAQQRRNHRSVNARWDNTTSILTGDAIFAKSFDVACDSGNLDVVRRIARSSSRVCEGEIIQNAMAGKVDITRSDYLRIISLKTAELCKCACGVGATLSECDPVTVERFERFGLDIGQAFQIIDDVLDVVGDPQRVGKTLGTDLANGKLTLPLIHCLESLRQNNPARANELALRLRQCSVGLDEARQLLAETGSIKYALNVARDLANTSLSFASTLRDTPESTSLRLLAEFVIDRSQ